MANRLKWSMLAIYLHRTWPSVGGDQEACEHEIPEHRRTFSLFPLLFSTDGHTRITLQGVTIYLTRSKRLSTDLVAMIVTKPPGRKRSRLPPSQTGASWPFHDIRIDQDEETRRGEDLDNFGGGQRNGWPSRPQANDTENNTTRKHSCLRIFNTAGVPEFSWPSVYVDERALCSPPLSRSKAKYLKGINYASVVRDRARFIRVRVHYARFFSLRYACPLFPSFRKRNNLKEELWKLCVSFPRPHAPNTRPC